MKELKRVRTDAGLTQAALAAKLSVAQSYVAKVEGGERRIDVVEFINWLDAADAFNTAGVILAYVRSAPGPNS
ncbi:MAG: helix-turn-helix transcriptional regulator [Loktanella sp.]|nr:helix-turn-helix transcriptional regulator [Loktanella sp.]